MQALNQTLVTLAMMAAATISQAADVASVNPFVQGKAEALAASAIPRYDHVVIAIMENENEEDIIGSANAPYINALAKSGALFTDSHGVTHPSQPNYIALFSGSTQGVTNDSCPKSFKSKANLASQLIAANFSFAGYSEDMPSVGYTGCSSGKYVRKHNPWVNFNNVPKASNQPFTAFPSNNFAALPTVSFVVPNLCNDNHDCPTRTGDAWLKAKLDAYVQWAKNNNSLLILTWDEDEFRAQNHITTIFVGAKVKPGNYTNKITHYNILRTLEDMYGLSALGNAYNATPITNIWM